MGFRRRGAAAVLLTVVAACAAAAAPGTASRPRARQRAATRPAVPVSYHNVDAGFSLRSPPGWRHLSPGALAQLVDLVMKPGVQRPAYVAGFASSPDATMDPPYMLVQYIPGRVSFARATDFLADARSADLRSTDLFRPDLADRVAMSVDPRPAVDPTSHRFAMGLQLTVPQGVVRGSSFGFVGRDGTVVVHCYAMAGRESAATDAFRSSVGSFAFDPGAEYAAAENDPPPVVNGVGLLGGVTAAVAAGVLVARRRAAG